MNLDPKAKKPPVKNTAGRQIQSTDSTIWQDRNFIMVAQVETNFDFDIVAYNIVLFYSKMQFTCGI